MSMVVLSLGVLAGAVFASAVMSLLLVIRKFEREINLSYCFLAVAVIINAGLSVIKADANELSRWVLFEKLQNTAMMLVGIAIIIFVYYLANKPSIKKLYFGIVPLMILIVINAFRPFGLAYDSVTAIGRNAAMGDYSVISGESSVWVWPSVIYLCYLLFNLSESIVLLYRSGEKRTAFLLGLSIGSPVLTVTMNLMFIYIGLGFFPFMENIGLSMMIIVITHRNFMNVIKSSETRAELQQSEERYRNLIEYMPDAVVVHLNGKILYANQSAVDLVGAEVGKQLEGKGVIDFVHPDYKKLASERLLAFDEMSSQNPVELKITRMDGSVTDIDIRGVMTKFNNLPAWQTVIRDVSSKKKAEQELRKFMAAVEQSSVGIVITSPTAIIEYANPKFSEICGYPVEELCGKPTRYLKSGLHKKEFYDQMWKTLLAGAEWNGELCNRKANGELYWEMDFISSVKNSDGEITHFIAIKEDITERKRLNEELLRSKEEAEEADRLKTTLLANMSHEFRTPLNGILGFAQILQDEITEFLHLEFVQKITKSAMRLSNTLNSVLMITELENKNYLQTNVKINLNEFCKEVAQRHEASALAKKLSYSVQLSDENIILETDSNMLAKIISALLDNAIKYTTRGNVSMILGFAPSALSSPDITIRVVDTGIGIREEHQAVIFREFKQISEGYERAYEGLGLGLALAQKMARIMGFEITVNSKYGEGSEFTVLIPGNKRLNFELQFKETLEKRSDGSENIPAELPNVLLVEDNSLNIEVVEYFLNGKCVIHSATTGEQALDLAARNQYDILLLDIHLGKGIDGVKVLTKLRESPMYSATPAVALTGYASNNNRIEFLSRGFNHVLTKPFNKEQLISVFNEVMAKL